MVQAGSSLCPGNGDARTRCLKDRCGQTQHHCPGLLSSWLCSWCEGEGMRNTGIHMDSVPVTISARWVTRCDSPLSPLQSGHCRALPEWLKAIKVLQKSPSAPFLRALSTAEPHNSISSPPSYCRDSRISPYSHKGRLQGQISKPGEGIPEGSHIFCMNNPVCPHCGTLPDIVF